MRNEEKVRRATSEGGTMSEALLGALCLLGILITVVVLSVVIVAARADRIVGDDE